MGVCILEVRERLMERAGTTAKWEYFVAPLLEHNPGEILNSFGEDGWELVNVVAQPTPLGALDRRVPEALVRE